MRRTRAVLAAASLTALVTAGCPGGADRAGQGGVTLGLACSHAHPCAADLLCVDGVCRLRPWPPDAAAVDTAPSPIDIAVSDDDAAEEPDTTWPLDAPDDRDTAPMDAADGEDAGPLPDGEDAGPLPDGEDAGPLPDGEDAGPLPDGEDAGAPTEVFVGEHTALVDPSDDALTLQGEQGAAAQLFVPAAGQPTVLEVLAVDPLGVQGCGRYRPALWRPDAAAGGAIASEPAWQGAAVEVAGQALPQRVPLDGAPALPVGFVRAGLIYEGVCAGSVRQPLIATDASGIVDQTWVWIGLGAAATWVDAATLRLSGRWALRLGVTISAR